MEECGGTTQYALLHHLLADLQAAVASTNSSAVNAVLTVWSSVGDTAFPALGPVAQDRMRARVLPNADADMPIWIISPMALSDGLTAEQRWLVATATATARRCGSGQLLELGLGVLVLLNPRMLGEAASSWTTSEMPCTVYTDYRTDPALFAQELVHESSHAILNDALLAFGEVLPSEPQCYSPWKGRLRPPYGILHSAWAFGNAVRYLTALLNSEIRLTPEIRSAASNYLRMEVHRLQNARDSIDTVLRLVSAFEIRVAVETTVEAAVKQAERAPS
jgi:hypothetical protein